MGTYIYFQPNPKELETGDCVIRSLCKATGKTWLYVYDRLAKLGRQMRMVQTETEVFAAYLEENGFTYHAIRRRKEARRQSVSTFCSRHKKGTYVLKCLCHVVCVEGGCYYDSWDSGSQLVYGYWKHQK